MPISKSVVARRLGISSQAVNELVKYKHGILEEVKVGGKALVSEASVLREIAHRMQYVANSIEASDDKCRCGCEETVNEGKSYIQGHDRRIRSYLQTMVRGGALLERDIAVGLARTLSISLEDLFGFEEGSGDNVNND
ncbi:hypothetical protein [Ammoniphilus sp. CFH 90114]|uniref:hypothetical protein n=1 Tax=Ammoniphilus sp. CFH 90114 TaxID=2493665 RepID=UPI00100E1DC6|nr:hypothetical protein [Ammoniphilus sp. CFH 90114]RXT00980.1 hypothetical protein EIZ39_25645 [Ammoniphilus sp. CFH 90114]